jgi:hypothetical protein
MYKNSISEKIPMKNLTVTLMNLYKTKTLLSLKKNNFKKKIIIKKKLAYIKYSKKIFLI